VGVREKLGPAGKRKGEDWLRQTSSSRVGSCGNVGGRERRVGPGGGEATLVGKGQLVGEGFRGGVDRASAWMR
jgi:hypothetical protein